MEHLLLMMLGKKRQNIDIMTESDVLSVRRVVSSQGGISVGPTSDFLEETSE
jgi:hypothetical protein